jgi:murein peptide amidase A
MLTVVGSMGGAVAAALTALTAGALAIGSAGGEGRSHFGESVRGETLKAQRLGDRGATRTALVVGSIHGDELAGHRVIEALRRRAERIDDVEVWTVRTVNPDGAKAGTRRNARSVDLNRNFPYRWQGGVPPSSRYYPGPRRLSEPESRAAVRLIKRIEPEVTIWYHQPWGAVLIPCHGPAPIEKRYARIARFPTDRCRAAGLHGTATSWQEHRVGGDAFVVELPSGPLRASAAHRHARAAAAVAMDGARPDRGR